MVETSSAEPRVPRDTMVDTLTGVRAIAAVWVVIEHFRFELYGLAPSLRALTPWIDSGYLGVEVFFVLSGFIISHRYADKMRSGQVTFRRFMRARIARIYPAHLVTLAIVAFLVGIATLFQVSLSSAGKYTMLSFLANILLLQIAPGVQAWNGPAWSISAEFLAYAIFPFVAIAIMKIRNTRSAALAAIIWLLCGTIAIALLRNSEPSPTHWDMAILRVLVEFTSGALLWRAWSLGGKRFSVWYDLTAVFTVVAIVSLLTIIPTRDGWGLLLMPLIALLIPASAGACGPISTLLTAPSMQFGGRISYSLYMVHFPILMIVGKTLPWEAFAGHPLETRLGVLAVYFGLCLIAAWAMFRIIEAPSRKWLLPQATDSRPSVIGENRDQ